MVFRGSQLRVILRDPARYVDAAQRPAVEQTGGSPQRPMLEACLRSYYRAGRLGDVAFEDLARRVARSTSEQREVNGSAVRSMLVRFLAWESREPDPEVYFPAPSTAVVGAHSITLSPSLTYALGNGYLIRHVWTEGDFSLRRPYTRLAAAAYLAHAEATLGVNSVRQLEFWHVRKGEVAGWQAHDLRRHVPSLVSVLDFVAASLGGWGRPGEAA